MAKEAESLVAAAAGDGGGNEYLYSQQEQNALGGMHQDSSQHTRRHNMWGFLERCDLSSHYSVAGTGDGVKVWGCVLLVY